VTWELGDEGIWRKQQSGAFWEGRYVELNMVRCGAVKHPRQWRWSGYEELMGRRNRNRLLDLEKLLWLLRVSQVEEFRVKLQVALTDRMGKDELKREAKWAEKLAYPAKRQDLGVPWACQGGRRHGMPNSFLFRLEREELMFARFCLCSPVNKRSARQVGSTTSRQT